MFSPGRAAPTYETAATRRFYKARTETVRSCTPEALSWCQAMTSDSAVVSGTRPADRGDYGDWGRGRDELTCPLPEPSLTLCVCSWFMLSPSLHEAMTLVTLDHVTLLEFVWLSAAQCPLACCPGMQLPFHLVFIPQRQVKSGDSSFCVSSSCTYTCVS